MRRWPPRAGACSTRSPRRSAFAASGRPMKARRRCGSRRWRSGRDHPPPSGGGISLRHFASAGRRPYSDRSRADVECAPRRSAAAARRRAHMAARFHEGLPRRLVETTKQLARRAADGIAVRHRRALRRLLPEPYPVRERGRRCARRASSCSPTPTFRPMTAGSRSGRRRSAPPGCIKACANAQRRDANHVSRHSRLHRQNR